MRAFEKPIFAALPLSVLIALTGMSVLPDRAAAQSQPAAAAPSSDSAQQTFSAEQLDQLVAPIALYPDTLLAEVLMASTYPVEVVEASRWADANKNLKAEQLKAAADKQSWDESVKSLTATSEVLHAMSSKLSWMQKLGDAVLAQQPDVMHAVQRLRTKAQAQNKLQSTEQQKVSVVTENAKKVIVIEPTEPNTIYVPYYDPAVVYGTWPYPAYPPYYFPAPGYIPGTALAGGLAFGAGIALGAWAANGGFWGGGVNWGGNDININRPVNIDNSKRNNWAHNPDHRRGVRYNNENVAQKFGRGGDAARANARSQTDFRGRDGKQVLQPSNDRAGAKNRPENTSRNGAGDRKNASNSSAGKKAASKSSAGKKTAGKSSGGKSGARSGGPNNAKAVKGQNARAQSPRAHTGGSGGRSKAAGHHSKRSRTGGHGGSNRGGGARR